MPAAVAVVWSLSYVGSRNDSAAAWKENVAVQNGKKQYASFR
jgi:hypothetical protein